MASKNNDEDILESIVDEQEKLKLRFKNLHKLVSSLCSAINKHQAEFPSYNEQVVKKLLNESEKVIVKSLW